MRLSRLIFAYLCVLLFALAGPFMIGDMLTRGAADLGFDEAWVIRRGDAPILFYGNLACIGLGWLLAAGFSLWVPLRMLSHTGRRRLSAAFLRPGVLDFGGLNGRARESPGWAIFAKLGVVLTFLLLTLFGGVRLWGAMTQGKITEFCRRCHVDTFTRVDEPDAFWNEVAAWIGFEAVLLFLCLGVLAVWAKDVRDWIRGEYW
jgi:hypothetical protein